MVRQNRRHNPPSIHPAPRGAALVVDQNPSDLWYYSTLLRRIGFEVRSFTNYPEAVASLDEEPADFVIVSQGTSAFEARDVLRRALADGRQTPVVVLAQNLEMEYLSEAMQMGAVDYVEKPLAPVEVELLVNAHSHPRTEELQNMGGASRGEKCPGGVEFLSIRRGWGHGVNC